jgi:hypothetical protein
VSIVIEHEQLGSTREPSPNKGSAPRDECRVDSRQQTAAEWSAAVGRTGQGQSWSIRRAIELLDEAIDRMGSQLARASSTSMDWSDEVPENQLRQPAAGTARGYGAEASASFDADPLDPSDKCGPDLP